MARRGSGAARAGRAAGCSAPTRAQAAAAAAHQREDEEVAGAPPLQQHETLGGLIARLRLLERDVGSDAYVVYFTSRADNAERLYLHCISV